MEQPLSAHYETLLSSLREAAEAEAADKDALAAALHALAAAIEFIEGDATAGAGALTRPLTRLALAIRDVMQGGRPKLFEPRAEKGGRPSNRSSEAAKGIIAATCDCLVKGGMRLKDAGAVIAAELDRQQIRVDGKRIDAARVLRWRDEIGGRASQLASSTFRDLVTIHREALGTKVPDTPGIRKRLAIDAIAALRDKGF